MILIALGSNMGAREQYLADAISALHEQGVRLLADSAVVETPALLPENAPREWDIPFLNQVIWVQTAHSPLVLLRLLKTTEQALGRVDRGRWSPREIDLDLLAYNQEILSGAELTVPHPRLHERRFVLEPLVQIAPEWVHPLSGKTARALLAELPA